MREKGNGEPYVCVQNLVNTIKTEVPFSRSKGINPKLIDKPLTSIEGLDADVTELIEEFEPRVNIDNVSVSMDDENGDFGIKVSLSPTDYVQGDGEEITE